MAPEQSPHYSTVNRADNACQSKSEITTQITENTEEEEKKGSHERVVRGSVVSVLSVVI